MTAVKNNLQTEVLEITDVTFERICTKALLREKGVRKVNVQAINQEVEIFST